MSRSGLVISIIAAGMLTLAAIWRAGALQEIIIDCSRNVMAFLIKTIDRKSAEQS
jgi:hypothetical protein